MNKRSWRRWEDLNLRSRCKRDATFRKWWFQPLTHISSLCSSMCLRALSGPSLYLNAKAYQIFLQKQNQIKYEAVHILYPHLHLLKSTTFCDFFKNNVIYWKWPHRLTVRTTGFQSVNQGPTPCEVTK
jgi:hypothetical protein